ncbi:DUF2255 family protein [Nonomuraea longicatena]|uniref:DUF2255 family protein n=1 Tax=Nonomuraea longicatena TaxID=83682 RepID=A0ABN1P385_9ACTN
MSTTWTTDELTRIQGADELQIAARGDDGALRDPVTIWVVRDGDDLFVRSFRGSGGRWFRAASASHAGHVQAGGVDKDVTFSEENDRGVNERVDAAYRAKYGRYDAAYVDPMVGPEARATTLRLVPN